MNYCLLFTVYSVLELSGSKETPPGRARSPLLGLQRNCGFTSRVC